MSARSAAPRPCWSPEVPGTVKTLNSTWHRRHLDCAMPCMPRGPRCFSRGRVYHLVNRGVRRQCLFAIDEDYQYFQRLIGTAQTRVPLRLLAYCLMPNHWHLVVWPEADSAVSAYMRWLTWSHACHFNAQHDFSGHVYQGRFKSRVVRDERHLLTLLRYVEANPVRASLLNGPRCGAGPACTHVQGWQLRRALCLVRPDGSTCWPSSPNPQVAGTVDTHNSTCHLMAHAAASGDSDGADRLWSA